MVTALYPLDGNPNDITGFATGVLFGTSLPSFVNPCYIGSQSLSLNSAFQQYLQIPSLGLTQTSFTIEIWLYVSGIVTGDFGIFGQCDLNGICLALSLRNGRLALAFDSMNTDNNTLTGTTILQAQKWTHVAVVYDAVLLQQQIYLNGRIDAVSRGMVGPYRGTTSGSTATIGRTLSSAYTTSYFVG
jgi:hypothetical protein